MSFITLATWYCQGSEFKRDYDRPVFKSYRDGVVVVRSACMELVRKCHGGLNGR
jgi:hypothetical protein